MPLVEIEAWMREARCRGLPAELFVLDVGQRPEPALAACNGGTCVDRQLGIELSYEGPCRVRDECSEYARKYGCVGIWGGRNIPVREGTLLPVVVETEVLVLRKIRDSRPEQIAPPTRRSRTR